MNLIVTLPKTVIFGATSFLGSNFVPEYRKVYPDSIGTCKDSIGGEFSFLDLLNPDIENLNLKELHYQDALILTALQGISLCEEKTELTRKVNVDGTLKLVKQLADRGIKPVFFSSDAVFDGNRGKYSDEDLPNPLSEYARQKVEIEQGIKDICDGENYLIVRLAKVFSVTKGDGTLLDEMAALLWSGSRVKAAYDQIFCPILVTDIISVVLKLQMKEITGVLNVCSSETWSRYDLAVALAGQMHINRDRVERISLDDFPGSSLRPKNTSMRIDRLKDVIDHTFTPMNQSIKAVADNWKDQK